MITIHVARAFGETGAFGDYLPGKIRFNPPRSEGPHELEFGKVHAEQADSYLGTVILSHSYTTTAPRLVVSDGLIVSRDEEQHREDFTRLWLLNDGYVLFWFRGTTINASYSHHRRLAAKCLSRGAVEEEDQRIVLPVSYDLECIRRRFPSDIWDQTFDRDGPISRGRIRGTHMETDTLWGEFARVRSFVGITVPVEGSNEKVKVLRGGRLQFMSWQAKDLEEGDERRAILKTIHGVLARLSGCSEANDW